jgi:ArsR family transcriptional regulator
MNMHTTSARSRPAGCCRSIKTLAPLPEQQAKRYLRLFKALGDPTRMEILRLTAAQENPLCVCDLVTHFDLSQSTISHHLKSLRDAGLLAVSRAGIWSVCEIDPEARALLADVPALI